MSEVTRILSAIEEGDLHAAALSRLAEWEPEIARLVELRFFAGLTLEESAECLGLSQRTAYRHWAYARAWLRRELDCCREE
jgi:DNA-directed RNA polymerase specialized sigma24 family protein